MGVRWQGKFARSPEREKRPKRLVRSLGPEDQIAPKFDRLEFPDQARLAANRELRRAAKDVHPGRRAKGKGLARACVETVLDDRREVLADLNLRGMAAAQLHRRLPGVDDDPSPRCQAARQVALGGPRDQAASPAPAEDARSAPQTCRKAISPTRPCWERCFEPLRSMNRMRGGPIRVTGLALAGNTHRLLRSESQQECRVSAS